MNDVESSKATFLQRKIIGLRLRTWALFLLIAPLLFLGGLNLIFSTAWGTGFLERKIEKKIGLFCQIESVTWSPWAGVSVRDFELYASGDEDEESRLLDIAEVNVDPSWRSLLKGKKRFETLEIKDLSGALSIEQLQEMMTRYHRAHPVAVVTTPTQKKAPVAETVPVPVSPHVNPHITPNSNPLPGKAAQSDEREAEIIEAEPVDDFAGTVILENANLRFYSQTNPAHEVELCDLSAEIPIWGKERSGELSLRRVEIEHYPFDLKQVFPLKWNGSSVHLEKQVLKVLGVDLEVEASLRMTRGLPIGLNVNLPAQQTDFSPLYPDRPTPIEFESLSSRNIFRMNLLDPKSLGGRSVTTFSGFMLNDPKDGGDLYFERGNAILSLNAGGLVANDVRAIGEFDSLLMNGFVTRGGEAAATVRIVSSPERAESHEKRIRSTRLPLDLDFEPLITPDREYHDFRIEARSGTLMVDLGVDEQWVPLFKTAQAILGRSIQPKPPLP